MNLKKMMVSSIAALTLMSGAAFAADNTNTVLAADGTGDYLVLPYYAAVGSWKTNVRVMNTDQENAVVAKVVIREYRTSAEKLDFLIFLSPGDVWEAQLVEENGKVVLLNKDSSLMLTDGTVPDKVELFPADELKGEDSRFGYIEVAGVAQIKGEDVDPFWVPQTQLDKEMIRRNYMATCYGKDGGKWKGVSADALTAQEILFAKNQYGNLAMTLNATAIKGVTGSEPNTKKLLGVDTRADNMFIADQGNSIEIAKRIHNLLLKKSEVYIPYYNNGNNGVAETVLVYSMPMKKYLFDNNVNPGEVGYKFQPVVPFKSPLNWAMYANMYAKDMDERATKTPFSGARTTGCNTEICTWDVTAFTKDFTDGYAILEYISAGGIPVAMTAKNVEGTNVTNIYYPAYK